MSDALDDPSLALSVCGRRHRVESAQKKCTETKKGAYYAVRPKANVVSFVFIKHFFGRGRGFLVVPVETDGPCALATRP